MNKEEKKESFREELSLIVNDDVKTLVESVLENAPNYFFEVPASSSGKYHPSFSLGDGGLVRHTKIAVNIANDMFTIMPFENIDKDIMIGALILHDCCKSGLEDYAGNTLHEHPLIAAELVKKVARGLNTPLYISDAMAECIKSHMGQWNTSKYSEIKLPVPDTDLSKFVHMCDYLASRKLFDKFK